MFEGANVRNTLLINSIRKFLDTSSNMVTKYQDKFNLKLNIGYVETANNSADVISKNMKNPVELCNAPIYRNGPGFSIKELKDRTILKFRTGKSPEFNAKKLMSLANQTENLKLAMKKIEEKQSEMAHVVTRARKKEEGNRMKKLLLVPDKSGMNHVGKMQKYQWKDVVELFLRGSDQICSLNYATKYDMDISTKIQHFYGHYYSLKSLLTVFFLLVRRLATNQTPVGERIIDGKRTLMMEAIALMYRTSQRNNPVGTEVEESFKHELLNCSAILPRLNTLLQ